MKNGPTCSDINQKLQYQYQYNSKTSDSEKYTQRKCQTLLPGKKYSLSYTSPCKNIRNWRLLLKYRKFLAL